MRPARRARLNTGSSESRVTHSRRHARTGRSPFVIDRPMNLFELLRGLPKQPGSTLKDGSTSSLIGGPRRTHAKVDRVDVTPRSLGVALLREARDRESDRHRDVAICKRAFHPLLPHELARLERE